MSEDSALPRGGARTSAMASLKEALKRLAHAFVDPLVRGLAALGVHPDHVTILGLALSVLAGVAFFDSHARLAAAFLTLSGLCDILDGQLARRAGRMSTFGAFLDSTLDRIAESAVLIGIAGYYVRNLLGLAGNFDKVAQQMVIGLEPVVWARMALIAMLALVGSFMVSYTRARAEGLGLECKVGWFERPERLVLLIVAGFVKVYWAVSAAILLLALFSFVTVVQRILHVHKLTRGAGSDSREA